MNRFTTSWGDFDLARYPDDPRDQLRAWDAADAYLLRHLKGEPGPDGTAGEPADLSGEIVVSGDRWGALSTALAAHRPTMITDSYLAREAAVANLARNGLAPDSVRIRTTQDPPPARIDVLIVRVPKSLALLEDQLRRLAPSVHAGTRIYGTGMVAEIHTSTLNLFTRILGPTRTSLAEKKARLIFTTAAPDLAPGPNPWPHTYALPDGVGIVSGREVTNHAGVFCAERLDIGTRFLLAHLPQRSGAEHVVDLGCGNGVVGTAAALGNPEARVTFVDESYQAVASAAATYRANVGEPADRGAEFTVADGLDGFPSGTADLVLNNPPFHSHQATTDQTAWRMFTGSRAALRPGGELWVVGNRHLGYHVKLKRIFGNCEVVASDRKFVVMRAVRR
ncbi:methyltransferase [Yinghuangia soli]|uniref:Ribosomal RNA large subunit methyltransferase G n=1 Tax=Yinghuangia soli TaxID=2908204 RepID=A0AA41U215_9ACTN|nr:methyltransferase [Yinghuangia soli]MCF2528122.1 methyltransferase [Yinghuangia soli]